MAKQLETQMNDVQQALGNLSLCLKLALDDKEQFIKEYGSRLYATLCKISAETEINECKVNEILDK
ncbi:hypothetical protein [Bacteroides sp.]|uniref:hypothetical protein n=1 Tax=Bacteroides sp. TaxID=29523 RepID=UPI0026331DC3|nr:hypothetical protein [Bacteroides sp.]MDD3038640.1 hypothetical protein [Bacteroides sp.]